MKKLIHIHRYHSEYTSSTAVSISITGMVIVTAVLALGTWVVKLIWNA